MRGQAFALAVVLAGTLLIPLGLRAVNGALPGATVHDSYLPSVETPRPREPFDEASAAAVREVQPEFVVIGDSMAGIRIDPLQLSRLTHRRVVGLYQQGSPVAYWYLAFKNLALQNDLKNLRGAIFFFRDDQLTTQVQVSPGSLDRVAKDREPELDRILAADRLGAFSAVHRAARAAYQYDRTRLWLEPLLTHTPAASAAQLEQINSQVFSLDHLRKFEAADLAVAQDDALRFSANVDRSLLPEIVRMARGAGVHLAFIRVQRRPLADGPPPQPPALQAYIKDLSAYLTANGAYVFDDWGDVDEPLSLYADGDHLTGVGRIRYTENFAARHARYFQ